MEKNLKQQAFTKFFAGFLMVALLLFVPAGTLRWTNAWVFMGLLFVPMFVVGLILMKKHPELLRKRLQAKERRGEQKGVIGGSAVMFLLGFVLCGLDRRFGWSALPVWLCAAAGVLFLVAYALYGEVLRENAYLSRTIEVQENQRVVDTGLYGIVRHPMYTATLLLFLSMPLLLGSVWGFAVFWIYPILIIRRIRDEEKLLEAELNGYAEYKEKVKYRLIPFVW